MSRCWAGFCATAFICACTARPALVTLKCVYLSGDATTKERTDDPLLVVLANVHGDEVPLVVRTLVDGQGKVYEFKSDSSGRPLSVKAPPGKYTLRVLADCQEPFEREVTIDKDAELDSQYPVLVPERAYTVAGYAARPLIDGAPMTLAANVEVERLRAWPTAEDLADRLQRIRLHGLGQAGGETSFVLRPDQCHDVVVSAGSGHKGFYLLAASALSKAPMSADEVARVTQQEGEKKNEAADAVKQRRAKIDADSDEEIKNGKCSASGRQALQQALAGLEQLFASAHIDLVMLDNAIVVATPGAKPLPFSFNVSGQYHIFSVGFLPSSLSGGAGTSPYGGMISNMTGADAGSTVVSAAPSNRPTITFSGRGCTLLVLTKSI